MKKYLLNYLIAGAMALFTVVGLQSFTAVKSNQQKLLFQDRIWFDSLDDNFNCNGSTFALQGTQTAPAGCDETKNLCCAIGYLESECTEVEEGVWELNPEHSPGVIVKYNP